MKYKLVALDIDGTILNSSGELSPRTQATIAKLRNLGVKVVLATGRRLINTLPFAKQLGLEEPLIVHNGAVVFDQRKQRVLFQEEIELDIAWKIHAELKSRSLNYVVYTGESGGEEILAPEGTWVESEDLISHYLGESATFVEQLELANPPIRFSIVDRPEQVDNFYQFLQTNCSARVNVMLFRAKGDRWRGIEIIPGNVSKGSGLAKVTADLGVKSSQVVAIGDNVNDLEMISWAGLGIAMGNSSQVVKAQADQIAPSNDEEGVAFTLKEIFLAKGE